LKKLSEQLPLPSSVPHPLFQCLTAHESSEIISVKGPAGPNLPEETLRCLISAVKLFFGFSACPSVPFLSRFFRNVSSAAARV